jgi:hypothetical protein
MKITIISLDNWGFNKHIQDNLEKNGHSVIHIDFNKFIYKYPNILYKIYNFFLKLFFKKNLKSIHLGKKINELLEKNKETQDIILTIKGDFVDPSEIIKFKNNTLKSIAFFNDSAKRCPRIIKVLNCFDEVYSFEKEDCKKYNLNFAPNWIYKTNDDIKKNFKYTVFNVTNKDSRFGIILKIAKILNVKNINTKILIFNKKQQKINPYIEFISKHISLEEVSNYIDHSQVLLDINRPGQNGLTFRVFESLGLQKKLITTNKDILTYDFYNPNNILIIDENNLDIPVTFFEKEYEKIPDDILQKYTLDGWIENVIFNNKNSNNNS